MKHATKVRTHPDKNIVMTRELDRFEKLLLFIIKFHVGMNAFATVGQKCLATESGLSRATVNKLVQSLERKGCISITKRQHPTNGYVCHEYRLIPKWFQMAITPDSTASVSAEDTGLYDELTGECLPSLHKDNIVKTIKTKTEDQVFADKSATTSQSFKTSESVGEDKVDNNVTSSLLKTNTHANVPVLEALWRTLIPKLFDDYGFVASLTMKERGQLKDFIDKLGDNDALKVLNTVLSNWNSFRSFIDALNICGSIQNTPSRPSIPFILTHVSHTVNFMTELENNELKSKAQEEELEYRKKQSAIDKASKEAALLEAENNKTDKERYLFQYHKISQSEDFYLHEEREAAGLDICGDEYMSVLEERIKNTFAKLLSEGSVQLHYGMMVSLDSKEMKKVKI